MGETRTDRDTVVIAIFNIVVFVFVIVIFVIIANASPPCEDVRQHCNLCERI